MAAASGLPLVPPSQRNPLPGNPYGTGEVISAALDAGCRKLVVGIGGSATNDGGAGMAQALGVRLLDDSGQEIGYGGGELQRIARIDLSGLDGRLKEAEIVVACDVDNPLCGPRGASAVYGPQKGATPEMVQQLDENLQRFAQLIKEQLGRDVSDVPGAGAAGGLGAGLMAFLDAELKPGIEITLTTLQVEKAMQGADLVITGEGKVDDQTVYGKVPWGVSKMAKKHGLPVLAFAGWLDPQAEVVHQHGIDAILGILPHPMDLSEAMAGVGGCSAAAQAMRLLVVGMNLSDKM